MRLLPLAGAWEPRTESQSEAEGGQRRDRRRSATRSGRLPPKPAQPAASRKVLVFTLTKGFRHGSIPLAAQTIELMGKQTGAYETVISEDLSMLQPEKLAEFDAFCSDQCTGAITDDETLKKSLLELSAVEKDLSASTRLQMSAAGISRSITSWWEAFSTAIPSGGSP